MANYEVSTDFLHIIAGTNNTISAAYTEAAKNLEDSDKTLKYLKNFISSIENIAAKNNAVDKKISASKGNMKDFVSYKSIDTTLKFLKTHKTPSGNTITASLGTLHDSLEKNQSYYEEGYRKGIRLIILEYESVLYMLISGLSMALSYNFDVTEKNGQSKLIEKPSTYFGVTGKTVKELATELSKKDHIKYLEDLIRAHDQSGLEDTDLHESVYTEGVVQVVAATLTLLSSMIKGAKTIVSFGVSGLSALKKSVFGIIPLIRCAMYLSYKRKADTILNLEQQAAYIEQNIEQLNTRTNIDPKKKEEIIKKQRAQAEAYMKRAAKIRAQLSETDKDVAEAIKREDPEMGKTDDGDFVLEGVDIESSFYESINVSIMRRRVKEDQKKFANEKKSNSKFIAQSTKHGIAAENNNFDAKTFLQIWKSKILPEILSTTKKQSIHLDIGSEIKSDSNPKNLTASKIGGTPYWPSNKSYPTYKTYKGETKPMILVAQLNFDELPHLDGYPTSGILQFFGEDLEFTYDAHNRYTYNTVIYHQNITIDVLQDIPITSCSDSDDWDMPVFTGVYFLKGSIQDVYMHCDDKDFDELFLELTKKHFGQEVRFTDLLKLSHEAWDTIWNDLGKYKWGTRIGGYPSFTQTDPRSYGKNKEYDTLLLQIDSENGIQWGDCGIANFFISKSDLTAKRFNNVFFTWDCY